jgi:hypothetical protein
VVLTISNAAVPARMVFNIEIPSDQFRDAQVFEVQ